MNNTKSHASNVISSRQNAVKGATCGKDGVVLRAVIAEFTSAEIGQKTRLVPFSRFGYLSPVMAASGWTFAPLFAC